MLEGEESGAGVGGRAEAVWSATSVRAKIPYGLLLCEEGEVF